MQQNLGLVSNECQYYATYSSMISRLFGILDSNQTFSMFIVIFFIFWIPWGRLSWLSVRFSAHVKILVPHRIASNVAVHLDLIMVSP